MASEESATLCWVADKSVDGEWHRARIVSQNEDGAVTLETLEAALLTAGLSHYE